MTPSNGIVEDAADAEAEGSDQTDIQLQSPDAVWSSLLADPAAPTKRHDLFDAAFSAIAKAIDEDPEARTTFRELMDRRMAKVAPELAAGDITEGLVDYFGIDGAFLVHWLAVR